MKPDDTFAIMRLRSSLDRNPHMLTTGPGADLVRLLGLVDHMKQALTEIASKAAQAEVFATGRRPRLSAESVFADIAETARAALNGDGLGLLPEASRSRETAEPIQPEPIERSKGGGE